jgi:transposase-like protein
MDSTTTTKPAKPRRKYTKEFKQQAVALAVSAHPTRVAPPT